MLVVVDIQLGINFSISRFLNQLWVEFEYFSYQNSMNYRKITLVKIIVGT